MLSQIHIRNYTIVDQLTLELDSGMTAMTGETGAGKSILVDALGLALGDRADSGIIRAGADCTEISACFDLRDTPDASAWLREHSMESGNDCVIRRIICREGRSRAFINDTPATMQALRTLGETLVDIHGQHQHQSLVKREIQRRLLDDFAGNQALLQQIQADYRRWKQLSTEFEKLRDAAKDSAARAELLRFQVAELEKLDLGPSEAAQLNEEYDRLANAGKLLEICGRSINLLYENEEGSAHQLLHQAYSELETVVEFDRDLHNASSLINEAMIQVQEAADELRQYLDRLELDPQRLQWVNERIAAIHELSRKHHVHAEELPPLLDKLRAELDSLDHSDEHLGRMQDEIDALRKSCLQTASALSRQRAQAAAVLNKKVTELVRQLGMPNAGFEIRVEQNPAEKLAPHGLDTIEYQVCTNPGQEFKPLSKIASGGELSRISLAIQVVLAETTRINTLVYDEVDTGIGGPTAEIVGKLLRRLGSQRQVLCVTHLPQVAAQAHHHLQVNKNADRSKTVTGIKPLTEQERVDEIARMLGGVKLTAQSRAHAQEMLQLESTDTA